MTNNEYQMLGMSQYMLREFRERCNQHEQEATETDTKIEYPHYNNEILGYSIFNNHACSPQNAEELIAIGVPENYRHWRFFFKPEPEQLPHLNQLSLMKQQKEQLEQSVRTTTAPLMLLAGVAIASFILLLLRGHQALSWVTLMIGLSLWFFSSEKTRALHEKQAEHNKETWQLAEQHNSLLSQLEGLPSPASLTELSERYRSAVGRLLRDALLEVLRPHEIGNLTDTLHNKLWDGFITESWGYLQVPLKAQEGSEINRILLNPESISLNALQDEAYGRKRLNIYRVQYLHIWILTGQGLLMGRAWFDRVTDNFLYEEHEFYPYAQLTHVRITEQILPEYPALKERFPDNIHRRFFRQSVTTISIGTTLGKTYECALPPASERSTRQTEWLDRYGLDSDMSRLNRRLHEHLYK